MVFIPISGWILFPSIILAAIICIYDSHKRKKEAREKLERQIQYEEEQRKRELESKLRWERIDRRRDECYAHIEKFVEENKNHKEANLELLHDYWGKFAEKVLQQYPDIYLSYDLIIMLAERVDRYVGLYMKIYLWDKEEKLKNEQQHKKTC